MATTEQLVGEGASVGGHAPMSLWGAAALVTGSMIGTGVYLLPATIAPLGSIALLGWLAALGAALSLAGVFAFLGMAAPAATGLPAYVQAGLGRFAGVESAVVYWAQAWIGNVGLAVALGGFLAYLVPSLGGPAARLAMVLITIWFSILVCALGPRVVARLEGLTLALGLAPVLLIAAAGWFWFDPAVFKASWNPAHVSAGQAVWRSGLIVFWAFLGVEAAAAVAGVVRRPERNVPRATLMGVAGSGLVYIAACGVLMGLVPAARLAGSSAPFAEAARAIIGVGGAAAIALCAALRAAGCLTGWTLICAETTRTAADEGAFPRFFRTRPAEGASGRNLLLSGALMTLVAMGTASPSLAAQFKVLADVTVILNLFIYILAAVSLLRLLPRLEGAGRRGLAAAAAVAAIICSLALIASGDLTELIWSAAPVLGAAGLYLALRTRTPLPATA